MSHPEWNDHSAEFVWNQSIAGKAWVRADGTISKANPEFCRILGYTEAELRSKTWMEITVEEDIEADRLAVKDVLEGRIPYHEMIKTYVYKGLLKRIPCRLVVFPYRDSEGDFACFFSQIIPVEQPVQRVQIVRHDGEDAHDAFAWLDWFRDHPIITLGAFVLLFHGPTALIELVTAFGGIGTITP